MSHEIDSVLRTNLTGEQYGAAKDTAREVLCLACAGSGKSRTMAFRIARLIAEGATPESIVAFTFTEKAADTIRRRVSSALQDAGIDPVIIGRMYIGTIHSFCQHLLGMIDPDFRQFVVLDENRLKLYLMSRYEDLDLQRFRSRDGRNRYTATIKEIAGAWQTANAELLDFNDVARYDPDLGDLLKKIYEKMKEERYLDFSLMIREAVEAIQQRREGVAEALEAIRHVLVDEYQDVNPAQEKLIRLLHREHSDGTLFVVGDDDQAIYEWRGADVSNILEFTRRYPNASTHTLSVNFRSVPPIVKAADHFINQQLGPTRHPKHPRAYRDALPREILVPWFPTREAEAEWVADRIQRLLGSAYEESDGTVRGLTPADFAILMRSTRTKEQDENPRHAAFTRALEARGIPYTLEAGGSPFDRPQVEVLRNVFDMLAEGPVSQPKARSFFNRAVKPAYPFADFHEFAMVLRGWGRKIHAPRGHNTPRVILYPQQLLHDLLESFHLDESNFGAEVMREIGLFSKMMLDVESVYMSIDSTKRYREVTNFLKYVAESGYDVSTDDLFQRPDAVTVSTVHKVKGLEFPCVFVVDVEQGRFPGRRRGYNGWLPEEVLQSALKRGAYQSTPEGEARLFYTAMTRAERYLYVTGAERLPGGRKNWKQSEYSALILKTPDREISYDPKKTPSGLSPASPRRRIEETDYPTSFSEIRYYLRCPKDYQFRHRYGFNPPVPEMFGFGQTVHASIEKLHERFPTRPPNPQEVEDVVRDTFHLHHVPRSKSGTPGPYERARDVAVDIAQRYVKDYGQDFLTIRSIEVTFEIPAKDCVISGSIDLVLREDPSGNITNVEIVDFKTMESESGTQPVEWTELALQVQLYARAAEQILGAYAKTGNVHFLKDGRRVVVPIDPAAIDGAIENVEWAVEGILQGDFPMRPHADKCAQCDFRQICAQIPEDFRRNTRPPDVHVPGNKRLSVPAFRQYDPNHRKRR